jgi:hypothetical protein
MKIAYAAMGVFLLPITAFADAPQVPTISSTCIVRSSPGDRDGSTVEYTWKITAKAKEQRVMSVVQLRRSVLENLGDEPWILGWEKALWCDADSTQQKEITLEIDQAPDGGERAFWFEGFVVQRNEDYALPKSASVSVTTREVRDEEDPGQLIDITVSNESGREISRHFVFISYASPADYPEFAKEADVDPTEQWKTSVWQDFMDPPEVKQEFRRFEALNTSGSDS